MTDSSINLDSLTEFEKDTLLTLLRERDQDRSDNKLDFMEWERYPEQNEILEFSLNRVKDKKSKVIIVAVLGGNRSGKSEVGGGALLPT